MLGTSGWIQVPPRFHNADRIVLHRYGHDPETIDARLTGADLNKPRMRAVLVSPPPSARQCRHRLRSPVMG